MNMKIDGMELNDFDAKWSMAKIDEVISNLEKVEFDNPMFEAIITANAQLKTIRKTMAGGLKFEVTNEA